MLAVLLIFSGFISSVVEMYGKSYIQKGAMPRKFLFVQTYSMIIICGLTFLFFPFELNVSLLSISLVLLIALVKIANVGIGADNFKYISAFERSAYTSLSIFVTYIIDIALGINIFTFLNGAAIITMLAGIVLLARGHLSFKNVGWKLIIRILCNIALGYLTYYALKEIGNLTLIFTTFFARGLILLPFYKYFTRQKTNKADVRFSFTSQTLSLLVFFVGNLLATQSVTYYMLLKPISMVTLFLLTLALNKNKKEKLSIVQIVGAFVIIVGVTLFTVNKM